MSDNHPTSHSELVMRLKLCLQISPLNLHYGHLCPSYSHSLPFTRLSFLVWPSSKQAESIRVNRSYQATPASLREHAPQTLSSWKWKKVKCLRAGMNRLRQRLNHSDSWPRLSPLPSPPLPSRLWTTEGTSLGAGSVDHHFDRSGSSPGQNNNLSSQSHLSERQHRMATPEILRSVDTPDGCTCWDFFFSSMQMKTRFSHSFQVGYFSSACFFFKMTLNHVMRSVSDAAKTQNYK